jgi:hypothetical protein
MMTGTGQFGTLGLGGMTSLLMVREGLARDDYKNPGWYKHPAGTVAYKVDTPAVPPDRKSSDVVQPGSPAPARVIKRQPSHEGH